MTPAVPSGSQIRRTALAGPHLWKRNMPLSIAGGTVCCMLLVQMVF